MHQQSSFADHHLIMSPPSPSSTPPAAAAATLKSLETILHGMWRASVLTCALLWIVVFYFFVFLWDNRHAPIDLWYSAFLQTAHGDKRKQASSTTSGSNYKLMEAGADEGRVEGHHASRHCDLNGTSSISRNAVSHQITNYELITRNEIKHREGIVRDRVPPGRLPLPACDDYSNRSTACMYSNKLELSFTFAPNPKVKGQQVKSPKSKGWEICIEESCVQVVKTKVDALRLNNNDDIKCDKVTQRGLDKTVDAEEIAEESHGGRESQSKDVTPLIESSSLSTSSTGKCIQGEDASIREPSIFGTLTKEKVPKDDNKRRSLPQTSGLPAMFAEKFAVETSNTKPCNGQSSEAACQEDETTPALVYQDGNLNSGTLEAFVQHMVPTVDYYPDRTYLFAFLLNSRLFIKPHQLLHDVCQVCIRQQKLGSPEMDRESSKKFSLHLFQLLIEWTETFPYDFRDERMMRHLRDITQKCVAVDQSLRKNVGQIMQALIRKLATLEKYEDVLSRVNAAATERMHSLRTNPAAFQTNIIDVCPSAYVLAQQLTHIELERLANIGPEEFVQSFLKEEKNDTTLRLLDLKRTKNLEAYVEWFNRLSYLVATEVCMHIKKKHRAKLIEYFIDVARECYNIGNFNSLMAIMSGLNLSPVTRLKKTWGKVNMDKFEILEHQMDPSGNFNTYRQSLRAAMQRALGAQDGACDKIVIPFFSLFVKDLYFLNEGCRNKLANGYINFQKFWQTAKQVTEFMTWKQVECPYPRDRQALNYLLTAPVFSENSLYLASYESEGPETNYERDQYKTLKLQCSAANK